MEFFRVLLVLGVYVDLKLFMFAIESNVNSEHGKVGLNGMC